MPFKEICSMFTIKLNHKKLLFEYEECHDCNVMLYRKINTLKIYLPLNWISKLIYNFLICVAVICRQ